MNNTKRKPTTCVIGFRFGDPYGIRTHVTAVKGRCLNRLTNGPGSGNLIRTDDIPGMNRLLYQLSYAAMCGQLISAPPKSASLLYPLFPVLSSRKAIIFLFFLAGLHQWAFDTLPVPAAVGKCSQIYISPGNDSVV